ncbi:hypothetical protein BAMA_05560 [Bacillus manliponensis]|uniref:DUF418 domain-containing protein n=1 Tax=Bacillus manliponensis TaxID=574376 RepID=A0A073JW33_9BACI|nr:DUF418 domain-containing protein [Bacillus manliponensis]KEK18485.1 hypothetical protein BAMA_05560 [Bacillus manliponensis]
MNAATSSQKRITSLDIIRGIALLGILFINIPAFKLITEDMVLPTYSKLDEIISMIISILITKKFFSIFSFLFGIGFYIFTSRVESRGDNPRRRFTRRLLSLFLIGAIQIPFFFGSILPIYAVIGFLLLPFYKAKLSTTCKWLGGISGVYVISLIAALMLPEKHALSGIVSFIKSDSTLIFIMFLAGFAVAKADWIRNVGALKKQIRFIQMITFPLFIGSSIWIASQANSEQLDIIIGIGTIPTVVFYVSTLFLLLEKEKIANACTPIANVGRMALTNYIAQSFIGLAIMSVMNVEVASPTDTVIIATLIFTIQIIYTNIWFKFFKMGPLEKVWRFMTYGKQK